MDKRIGAQYFTIRDYIKTVEDFEESCKKIKDIGYSVVQISGCPLRAGEIKPILDKYGLTVATTHRSFDDFLNNLDEIIDYNKALGCKLCGVGMMPGGTADDFQTFKNFIKQANEIAKKLYEQGLYFGYHNHSLEFLKYNDKTLFEMLVNETDSEAFRFILDTYWLQLGGMSPQKVIRELGKRAMVVHFKECRTELPDWQSPKMAEIGTGTLNWDEIIKACEDAGTEYAIVEQDTNWIKTAEYKDGDPFESLKKSYEYLIQKGFC